MFYANERKKTVAEAIFTLWLYWAISVGCLTLPILLSPWISAKFLPLLEASFVVGLIYYERNSQRVKLPACFRLTHIAQSVLIFSALIMIPFLFYLNQEGARELTGQPANVKNQQLPVLIIAPMAMIVSLYYMIRRRNSRRCRACHMRSGFVIDRSIIGNIFGRESVFQIQLLFFISALVTFVDWGYYLTRYINVNINRTDMYFFTAFPIIIYVLTLIYLGSRYYTMILFYSQSDTMLRQIAKSGTSVRYLVISGDKLLVAPPRHPESPLSTDDLKFDIPFAVNVPYRKEVPVHEAKGYFEDGTGIRDFEIRALYETHGTPGMYNDEFHFAVYLPDNSEVPESLTGEWFNIREIDLMMKDGLISNALSAEIHRIYIIAMAWKTYDRNGKRLYPIRNYRPTFRLQDMRRWDVDFNDTNWFNVAIMNEDKPFYRLRRMIARMFNYPSPNPSHNERTKA